MTFGGCLYRVCLTCAVWSLFHLWRGLCSRGGVQHGLRSHWIDGVIESVSYLVGVRYGLTQKSSCDGDVWQLLVIGLLSDVCGVESVSLAAGFLQSGGAQHGPWTHWI